MDKSATANKTEDSEMQRSFFVFSDIKFRKIDDFEPQSAYQFFILNKYTELEKLDEMESHLFITVFRFWMPYMIFATVVYLVIIRYFIDYVAQNMTRPFLKLSEKIRLNVKNVQKTKLRS